MDDSAASTKIKEQLRPWAEKSGLVTLNQEWSALSGGQTNLVWRVGNPGAGARVVKLHRADRVTPLFPNEAEPEWRLLTALRGTGIAPPPIGRVKSPFGTVLVTEYVQGKPDPAAEMLAQGLKQVHGVRSVKVLRKLRLGSESMINVGVAMLQGVDQGLARRLERLKPTAPPTDEAGEQALLHGDPVPENVLSTPNGIVFVDWQCPAQGDPIFDIAIALSPSMRMSCAQDPFTAAQISTFWSSYRDTETERRYRRWQSVFAWRFACYAAWQYQRGNQARASGIVAEIELLESLRD